MRNVRPQHYGGQDYDGPGYYHESAPLCGYPISKSTPFVSLACASADLIDTNPWYSHGAVLASREPHRVQDCIGRRA